MRALTSDQLTRMRSTVEGNFPSFASIARASTTKNARGEDIETKTVVAVNVPCRVEPKNTAREVFLNEQIKSVSDYSVYFAHGTDVRPSDDLLLDGLRLQVLESYSSTSNQVSVMVLAQRLRAF